MYTSELANMKNYNNNTRNMSDEINIQKHLKSDVHDALLVTINYPNLKCIAHENIYETRLIIICIAH